MKKPITITGLDMGSSKFCAVSAEIGTSGGSRILGIQSVPGRGVQRGHVVDLNLAVDSVSRLLERLEEKSSRKADNVYANISGQSIAAQKARGMVSLSMSGREITEGDMRRCVSVASTIRLPFDRDIIHKIVHSYTIDDQTELKNPLGLYGSRLAVEIYVVSANINHMQNIQKVINNCGRELRGLVFSGMADSLSLLDNEEREASVILVDIGSSLTEVSMFQEGVMKHVEVASWGASDLRGTPDADDGLRGVILRIKEKTDEFDAKNIRFRTVIVSGGGSLVDGMIEAFESGLGIRAGRGMVKGLTGNISSLESVIATTAIGLARFAGRDHEKNAKYQPNNLVRNLSSKIVDTFNNYF